MIDGILVFGFHVNRLWHHPKTLEKQKQAEIFIKTSSL